MAESFMTDDVLPTPVSRWRALFPPAQWLRTMKRCLVSLYVAGAGKGNQRVAQDGPDGSAP